MEATQTKATRARTPKATQPEIAPIIAPKRARTRQGATQSAPALAAASLPAPALSLSEAVRTGYADAHASEAMGATFGGDRSADVRERISTLRERLRKPSLSMRLRSRAPRWSLVALLSRINRLRLHTVSAIKLAILSIAAVLVLAILFPSAPDRAACGDDQALLGSACVSVSVLANNAIIGAVQDCERASVLTARLLRVDGFDLRNGETICR